MTNTETHTGTHTGIPSGTEIPSGTPSPASMPFPDPRPALVRSIATAQSVIDEVTSSNATRATPCADWNAHQMAGHLVAVIERIEAVAHGRDVMQMALVREDIAIDGLAAAFASTAANAVDAWTADKLAEIVTVPFGVMPGAPALAVYTAEILAHTWDLSRAVGVEPVWHLDDTAAANAATRAGLPRDGRDMEEMPFDPVVPTADDAPAIDQLVAWLGRDPQFAVAH